MKGNNCSVGRLQWLLVLGTLGTFVLDVEGRKQGPEIVTYGDCSYGGGRQLPYQVQTPFVQRQSEPEDRCEKPVQRSSLAYKVEDPNDRSNPLAPRIGTNFPVAIQEPLLPRSEASRAFEDPLRGRSYGVDVEPEPYGEPYSPPSLGLYDFGVQESVPVPRSEPQVQEFDPYQVKVEPLEAPRIVDPRRLGPMTVGVQHPAESLQGPGHPARRAPRLRGLTSTVDRILLPVDCDPSHFPGARGGPSRGGFGSPRRGGFGPTGSGRFGPNGNGGFAPSGNNGYGPDFGSSGSGGFGPTGSGGFGPSGRGGFGPTGSGGFGPSGRGGFGPSGSNGYGPEFGSSEIGGPSGRGGFGSGPSASLRGGPASCSCY